MGNVLTKMSEATNQPGPGPFLTVKEAASLLGVSTRTVYGWIRDGRIPSVRLGPKLLRVPTEQLMELARKQQTP